MHSVEELSVVSDLNNWGNCNVQFIGKLSDSDDGVYSTCVGIEPNINKNPSSTTGGTIRVDFSLSAQDPPRGVPVRIWGELETKIIQGRTVPIVRAKVSKIHQNVQEKETKF